MEPNSDIPAGVIGMDYMLDPATEDFLLGSDELKPGMVVLIENYTSRHNNGTPLDELNTTSRIQVLTAARWCKVEKLRTIGINVHFVGVYADGTKMARSYPVGSAWIVKINSIPTAEVS